MQKFQERFGLHSFRSHGEAEDADERAAEASLPRLQHLAARFDPEDVFNADEFGLFYAMAPERTIARAPLPGRKKQMVRLSYLACCNATGTERYPLMIIGNSARPPCFKRKSGADLGFDYHSNKKAWMTGELFTGWFRRFSSYISRIDEKRNVLLLIDNCSAHGSDRTLPAL